MSRTSSESSVRSIRRSVRWFTLKEYVGGALWVLPSVAGLLALAAGYGISQIDVLPGSRLNWIAFQGTADDARALLIAITSTVVTVIALVLGLTVVALQFSSTQFSPRLLRNFLRDRGTQVVLSAFIATFVYSAAGLFAVGVGAGSRTETYPRLAVSGAIVLLFVSLGMVYFADHLVHSIQIDAINRRVERNTRRAIAHDDTATVEDAARQIPESAVPLLGRKSGYIQTVYPLLLLPMVSDGDVTICLRKRVGEHVVAGTVIGWIWAPSRDDPPPDAPPFEVAVDADVRIGFERTIEQDIAFGIRQQIDIGCKALSAAINDPYTAVQAIDHLSVVCCDLAVRPLGTKIINGPGGRGHVVVIPGNNFADYIFFIGGLFGRYGSGDLTVMLALLRLFETVVEVLPPGSPRLAVLDRAAAEALADAERSMPRPPSLERVRAAVAALRSKINSKATPAITGT